MERYAGISAPCTVEWYFNSVVQLMNKLKYAIPGRILKTLYCTLIQPYLSYGILIWGSTCKSYLDKLVKLQKMGNAHGL